MYKRQALIKPQFEAGREKVGKKGVVRDPKVHEEVIEKICDFASSNGFELLHLEMCIRDRSYCLWRRYGDPCG